jgi:glutathione S-transferase
MQLYYFPTSPFVRKVMITLLETGQTDDVELVQTTVTPLVPDDTLMSKNPLSKIPALARDDGPTLYDSRVICAYLDSRAEAGLYKTGEAHWDVLTLEATADGIMEAAILMVYEGRLRPEDKRFPEWVESQWNKVRRSVDMLDARWMAHLNGAFDMGQIAVGCALAYLDFRHGDRDWRTGNAALAAWYEAFAARPSMIATRPPEA